MVVPQQARAITIDFASDVDALVLFEGGPGDADTFEFVDGVGGYQFVITSVADGGVGDSIGDLGYMDGTFTIGVVSSPAAGIETAPVTGAGTLTIDDGAGFSLAADLGWDTTATVGTGGNINVNGVLNLTIISYGGVETDLLALATAGSAIEVVDFSFEGGKSLTELKEDGAVNATSFVGEISTSTDCCTTYYRDHDQDGYGVTGDSQCLCSPSDEGGDCDDNNSAVNPGATEVCNGIDDDCNELTDEGLTQTFCRDVDEDGHGDPNDSVVACAAPTGYVANCDDCDDGNPSVYPGATEMCNGIDDDCDGQVDEGNADLSVRKSASRKNVKKGESLTYTIVVTNNGPGTASNVTLTDTLPSGVAFVSASPGGCAPAGSTVTCNIGTLGSGASVPVTITVTVTAGGHTTLVNEACVSSSAPDCDEANNCASITTQVVGRR